MNNPQPQPVSRIRILLQYKRVALLGILGMLALVVACYPTSEVSYSSPQDSSTNQWLIEFKTGEAQVQLTMRYTRKHDEGYGFSNNSFMVSPDQLVGFSREQAMSSGTNVKFQLNRDAGTFNFEGWFKEGNGSGHFTFSPNASFAGELNKQGFEMPSAEQQLALALHDVGFAFINELRSQATRKLHLTSW